MSETTQTAAAPQHPQAKPFRGLPAFFRACCREASIGGGNSYRVPGWHLAIHLDALESYDYEEPGEFEARIVLLCSLLESGDRKAVLAWLIEEYPRCMQLVPARRRQSFLNGIFDAWEEGRIRQ